VADVLLVVIRIFLSIAIPWWIVRHDMKKLSEQQLARAWNDASFWVAVVVFNELCIPVHFVKVRRSLIGLLLGIFWLAVAIAVSVAALSMAGALLGVE
jgi:hypothetical protein